MALVVDRYELGPASANCYVVRAGADAREALVVDPGGPTPAIDGHVAAILITHGDLDHVAGVADLADRTRAPVYGPPQHLMPEERVTWLPVRPYTTDYELRGGETLQLAGLDLEVIAVAGHSPDHVAFLADGALFSGDLLFERSVGRTDLPGGDWDALVGSIRVLLDRLPPDTVVYPGHGPATTLGAERDSNPFLAELRA